ncbi:MAG: hypothetical protein ACJ71W_04290 [Terriglobales bacterium]
MIGQRIGEALDPFGIAALAFLFRFGDFSENPLDFWRKVLRMRYLAFSQAPPCVEHILKRCAITAFAFLAQLVHRFIQEADGALQQRLDMLFG